MHRMRNAPPGPVRRGTGLGAASHGDDLSEWHIGQPWEDLAPVDLRVGLGVAVVSSPAFLGRSRLGARLRVTADRFPFDTACCLRALTTAAADRAFRPVSGVVGSHFPATSWP